MLRILDMSGPQNDLFSFWAPKKRRKDLTWNIAGVTADYRFLLCFFSLFFLLNKVVLPFYTLLGKMEIYFSVVVLQ